MRDFSVFSNVDGDVTQPPVSLAGLKILVVDDDEDSRIYISAVLEADGACITTASSASEALEVLPQLQPDVLVCDIAMPGEDGYTLMRRVRAVEVEKVATVPSVALTACAGSEDRVLALEAGFQAHVTKPVDPEDLIAAIASVLGFGQA
jgi:CheY-like chemotaxis protein